MAESDLTHNVHILLIVTQLIRFSMAYCSTIDCIMSSSYIIHATWHTSTPNSNSCTRNLYFIIDRKIKNFPGAFHLQRVMRDGRGSWQRHHWAEAASEAALSPLTGNSDGNSTPPRAHHQLTFLPFMILRPKGRHRLYYHRCTIMQGFSTTGDFAPHRTLGNVCRNFSLSSFGGLRVLASSRCRSSVLLSIRQGTAQTLPRQRLIRPQAANAALYSPF